MSEYDEGRFAYVAGAALDTNPYQAGSRQYQQWAAGWEDMKENDPLEDADKEPGE